MDFTEHETTLLPIEQLKPNTWNPNRMSPTAWQALGESITQYGPNLVPLVVRPYGDMFQILDGEHRYKWAKELGITELSVVIVDVDDFNAKKLGQILNRTRGADDPVKLKELIDSLLVDNDPEELIKGLPIASPAELDQILNDLDKQIMAELGVEEDGGSDEEERVFTNEHDRHIVPIVLTWAENKRWEEAKEAMGIKRDKEAFMAMVEASLAV